MAALAAQYVTAAARGEALPQLDEPPGSDDGEDAPQSGSDVIIDASDEEAAYDDDDAPDSDEAGPSRPPPRGRGPPASRKRRMATSDEEDSFIEDSEDEDEDDAGPSAGRERSARSRGKASRQRPAPAADAPTSAGYAVEDLLPLSLGPAAHASDALPGRSLEESWQHPPPADPFHGVFQGGQPFQSFTPSPLQPTPPRPTRGAGRSGLDWEGAGDWFGSAGAGEPSPWEPPGDARGAAAPRGNVVRLKKRCASSRAAAPGPRTRAAPKEEGRPRRSGRRNSPGFIVDDEEEEESDAGSLSDEDSSDSGAARPARRPKKVAKRAPRKRARKVSSDEDSD